MTVLCVVPIMGIGSAMDVLSKDLFQYKDGNANGENDLKGLEISCFGHAGVNARSNSRRVFPTTAAEAQRRPLLSAGLSPIDAAVINCLSARPCAAQYAKGLSPAMVEPPQPW